MQLIGYFLIIFSVVGTIESLLDQHHQKNKVCSYFAGLSSHTDIHLYEPDKLISNIRHQVSFFTIFTQWAKSTKKSFWMSLFLVWFQAT